VFSALAGADIAIRAVSTSPIRVTCVIDEQDVDKAVRRLHETLDPPKVKA
jgi:aspartokinase